tara:strand:+ start:102 stop:305 length:204 start_codon:yes stop_codon:yes gene_type:complete
MNLKQGKGSVQWSAPSPVKLVNSTLDASSIIIIAAISTGLDYNGRDIPDGIDTSTHSAAHDLYFRFS